MIASSKLPEKYAAWNRQYGAPFGRKLPLDRWVKRWAPWRLQMRYAGPFAFQSNNTTRFFEYPWAYFATPLGRGARVLEIGGGLSGFQFVLAKEGLHVVNVDPGPEATGRSWRCDNKSIETLNRHFGTDVELRNTVVTKAGLESGAFDRAFSISVLEHLPDEEIEEVMHSVFACLKPGGYFVLTIDLFLHIAPFTSRVINEYGRNIDVKRIVEMAPFILEKGDPSELHGFPEFSVDQIRNNLSSYLVGQYPAMAQCLVLRKPD